MASNIDDTVPITGNPTTSSVRTQFTTAKSEITALQDDVAALPTVSGNNTWSGQQTLGEIKETVYSLSGVDIDPANGSIQSKSLTGNVSFTESLESGQSVVLMLSNGDSHAVTWPTTTWAGPSGDEAPTLTSADVLVLWKVGSVMYGAYVGSYA